MPEMGGVSVLHKLVNWLITVHFNHCRHILTAWFIDCCWQYSQTSALASLEFSLEFYSTVTRVLLIVLTGTDHNNNSLMMCAKSLPRRSIRVGLQDMDFECH